MRGLAFGADDTPDLQGAGDPGLDRIEFVVRGIELDDDVLERYRLPDPLDLPAGSYSDMMFGRQHLPPVLPYIEAGA